MDNFATQLNQIVSWPITPWLLLAILVVFLILQNIRPKLSQGEDQKENPLIRAVRALGWFLLPLFGLLFIAILVQIFKMWTNPPTPDEALALRVHYLAIVGFIGVLGGILGAFTAYLRIFTTERQTSAQETGLITDRINKAVENLGATRTVKRQRIDKNGNRLFEKFGNDKLDFKKPIFEEITEPNLEVRIGGIYALERIARENLDYHIQIMESLTAYIRENTPVSNLEPTEPPFKKAKPRTDLQTVVTVIGRRSRQQIEKEVSTEYRLDLSEADLSGMLFEKGDFSGATLIRSRLEAASFRYCILHGTRFTGSLMNFADFHNADLLGAVLNHVVINRPVPHPGGMVLSINMAKSIRGISLVGADLTAVDYFGEPDQRNETFGTKDTLLTSELNLERENLRDLQNRIRRKTKVDDSTDRARDEKQLAKTGFKYWCPFDSSDLATGHYYNTFLDDMGLFGFPFR